jgi:polysaccharide export outer membrane protein
MILFMAGCSFKKDYILFNESKTFKEANSSIIHKNIKFSYKIIPHDRISLIVYQHPDLSTTTPMMATQDKGVMVDSEGIISLALLEDVHIAGLTQKEAAKKIEEGYDKYLNYAKVRVDVLNKRAYVIGEVNKPGEFPLQNEQLTLLQAIAQAGDFTDTANRQQILIIRSKQNGAETIMIDLTDKNSITHASLMIKPNDIVYVIPTNMKAINTNIASISPILQVIGTILSSYVSFDYITNR